MLKAVCLTLCCPCTTDPSSWYATCHFLRAGEYSGDTGEDLDETGETRRAGAWSPPRCSLHTLDWSQKTHEPAEYRESLPCDWNSTQPWKKKLTAGCKTGFYLQTRLFYISNVLHYPIEKRYRSTTGKKHNQAQKHSPRSSFFKRSNFRFAAQLFQIQRSFRLSGWLAAPP